MFPAALTALHLTLSLSAEALAIASRSEASRGGGKEGGRMSVRLARAHEACTLTGREEEPRQRRITE